MNTREYFERVLSERAFRAQRAEMAEASRRRIETAYAQIRSARNLIADHDSVQVVEMDALTRMEAAVYGL